MVKIVERPLRWDYENGCYKSGALRVEWFSVLSGRISMGDVDGCVEIKGKFLWFEWKSVGGKLQRSQEIMYEQLMKRVMTSPYLWSLVTQRRWRWILMRCSMQNAITTKAALLKAKITVGRVGKEMILKDGTHWEPSDEDILA